MEKKPYLVDVPVKVNIWIRPECQKKQFEVIKEARPSILFVTSDGGRNEKEWELIRQNRKLYDEGIDWDCTVYKLYMEENLGMYAIAKKRNAFIWSKVDRCIFLEDDQIPSVSFFSYCAELLEKYKDDERIECICGMNHLGVCEEVQSDYFFARQGSIWGTATWKRTVADRGNFDYAKDPYVMKLLKQRTRHNPIAWKRLNAYAKQEYYEGHVPGVEFWTEFHMYSQNRLQIIPKHNMISNVGFGEDSIHFDELKKTPPSLRGIFNMKTYELEGPIKHAQYVIPDIEYEKKRNRIMCYNDPIAQIGAKLHRVYVTIRYLDFAYIGKLLKRLKRKKNEQRET